MSNNEWATRPELPEPFPNQPRVWRCPTTGLKVPKGYEENLAWRAKLLRRAEQDEGLQRDLYTAASHSLLYWINAFAFTVRVFDADEQTGEAQQSEVTHMPFITWEIQDDFLLRIQRAIREGWSNLTDKSRDMGATWGHIVALHHEWLFRPDRSLLEISRKESVVDQLSGRPTNYPWGAVSDPGTLFGKHDYINSRLPEWMLPAMNRKKLHLVNLDNGSRIDGESANATAGSSDRRTVIFLDEMAKMAEGESIKRSTRDVTACRLVCSTPNGAGTAYSQWRMSGQIPVYVLPWWEHPEKGRGRYVYEDEKTGKYQVRSPWYDAEEKVRTPKEMAIEVDMDHIGSGDTFFDPAPVEEHRRLFAKPAPRTLNVDFKKGIATDAIPRIIERSMIGSVKYTGDGPLKVWADLIEGRPDQSKNYVIGIDVSKGQGASNSVASIGCIETREKIAEWSDANTPPYEFARIVCALALWVGGSRKNGRPLLIWEKNGPGWDLGRQVVKTYRYPYYFMDRQAGTSAEKQQKKFGWQSTPEKKEQMLGAYRRALVHGGIINHSDAALEEALGYIYFADGSIGPARLVEESANARRTHGDRVIADGLMVFAMEDQPKSKSQAPSAPSRSPAWRKEQMLKRKRLQRRKDRFDFNVGVGV